MGILSGFFNDEGNALAAFTPSCATCKISPMNYAMTIDGRIKCSCILVF